MKLTLMNRLKLCFEILFVVSGITGQWAHEKHLSTYKRGYSHGKVDAEYNGGWTREPFKYG